MESKKLLKANLEMNLGMISHIIEDMEESALVFPTPNGGCHPLWIIGHLAYATGSLVDQFMNGSENSMADWKSMFADGTEPSSDKDFYPPFNEVVSRFQEVYKKKIALLDSYDEEKLDAASKGCPPEYQPYFGTHRKCFLALGNHLAMHRGQLADVRRTAKLPRVGP